MQPWCAKT